MVMVLLANSAERVWRRAVNCDPPVFDRKSLATSLSIYCLDTRTKAPVRKHMERMRNDHPPVRKADLDTLKRELERAFHTVKSTCGDRREQNPRARFMGMVIRGK
jgi:hypothetical protein